MTLSFCNYDAYQACQYSVWNWSTFSSGNLSEAISLLALFRVSSTNALPRLKAVV